MFHNMKVLVSGANGYIGRHVVKSLLDEGHSVIACDIHFNGIDNRAEQMECNIFDNPSKTMYQNLGSPDVCLHMAWRNGFIHNADTQMGDLSDHYRFLTSMVDGGLKRLAVMGTMHEIGYWEGAVNDDTPCNPISMYGIAKDALRRSMMLYCNQHNCKLQWLRCFYILGDDRRNNSIFCKLLEANERGEKLFSFTSGKNKYDFIEVENLAWQINKAVSQDTINGIINCCSGKPVSLAERVEKFIVDNNLSIRLDYGKYPDRAYDSPCIYGDPSKINQIIDNLKLKK